MLIENSQFGLTLCQEAIDVKNIKNCKGDFIKKTEYLP